MSDEEPKAPEIKEVDFADDFHDLCHHWWQGCDDLRLHFHHWREYIWHDRWRSWTLCRIGRHSVPGPSWRYGKFDGFICSHCETRLPPPPQPGGKA